MKFLVKFFVLFQIKYDVPSAIVSVPYLLPLCFVVYYLYLMFSAFVWLSVKFILGENGVIFKYLVLPFMPLVCWVSKWYIRK